MSLQELFVSLCEFARVDVMGGVWRWGALWRSGRGCAVEVEVQVQVEVASWVCFEGS